MASEMIRDNYNGNLVKIVSLDEESPLNMKHPGAD